jgi:hypothetical protein
MNPIEAGESYLNGNRGDVVIWVSCCTKLMILEFAQYLMAAGVSLQEIIEFVRRIR